ncbi:PQQ-dependent sugar dehydrogenase [Mycolicibacterium sp. J2]|uniref:PQQ-dependent sugar dehydrogenase n=1 Tax=Mycolicibacterium sp. J2 TaxID=2993511 RepID=UPI002B05C8EA|nr:PQQ-dependent sugar dehydrogenase [Mycolicibacterium sp. J2]
MLLTSLGELVTVSHRHASSVAPSGYARYVGRVGALAVALGVTGAVATTPGIARADDTSSSSSSSSPSGSTGTGSGSGPTADTSPTTDTSATDGTPSAGSTTGTGTGTTTGTTGSTGATSTTTHTGSQTETDLGGGVIIRSSGGNTTHTTGTTQTDPKPETDTGTETPDVADTTAPGATDPVEQTDTGTPTAIEEPSEAPEGSPTTPDPIPTPAPDPTPTPDPTPASTGTGGHTDPQPATQNTTPPSAEPSAAAPTGSSAAQLFSAAAAVNKNSSQATTAAVPAAAAVATANPVTTFIKQLPTPNEVFQQVKSFVTGCACTLINQTLKLVNGLSKTISNLMASGGGGTGDPAQTPILWTMVAWVRRQIEGAVTAFNRSPLGEFVHDVTTQITTRLQKAISSVTNSPLGYTISSRLTRFLQECNGTVSLPDDLDRLGVVSGLNEPTDFDFITHLGDDGKQHIHAIVIIEKSGAIKIYDTEEGTLSTLTSLPTTNANGERGLVGVEVDPYFNDPTSAGYHKIYVAYTNAQNYDQLSKLTVDANLTTVLDEEELLRSDQLGNDFHHGGELEFDPTGTYLYWAVGNNVVNENSHDLTTIHGKILRMNRDGSAPEDNPFYNDPNPDVVKQIYAIGFRNPFRFGFAPDGTLLSGDVGEASWEELNVVVAGGDYGWPQQEGPCSSNGCGDTLPPLWAYHHTLPPANVGSITSVLYYDGTTLPEEYRNKVFVADYSVGWIKMLTLDDQFESVIDEKTLDTSAGATVQLKQGIDGNIYQLSIYPGTLSVITASGGNKAPVADIDASATYSGNDSLTVAFDGTGSSDPDGPHLTYQWNFGNGQTSTSATPTVTFTNTGANYTAYTVTLTVTDDGGKTNTATQRIVVGSVPPTIQLGTIADNYNAGDTITFSAAAGDAEDGPVLPPSAFEWKVVFHHNTHTHPFVDSIVGTGGSVTIPTTADQLATTWYRIELTVTDSSGLKTTTSKDVFPNLTDFTVTASNPNATFTVDGVPHTGSFSEKGVVGVQRVLSAPSTQHTSAGELIFIGWGDGGAQTHTVTTPASDANYSVTFGLAPALV